MFPLNNLNREAFSLWDDICVMKFLSCFSSAETLGLPGEGVQVSFCSHTCSPVWKFQACISCLVLLLFSNTRSSFLVATLYLSLGRWEGNRLKLMLGVSLLKSMSFDPKCCPLVVMLTHFLSQHLLGYIKMLSNSSTLATTVSMVFISCWIR